MTPRQRMKEIVEDREARKNRVYISGPMTGKPDYNFPLFNAAAHMLKHTGFEVMNPAEHGLIDDAKREEYLAFDVEMLSQCGLIYMLPGWETSDGAMFELFIAKGLGLRVIGYDKSIKQFGEEPGKLALDLEELQEMSTIMDAIVQMPKIMARRMFDAMRDGKRGWNTPDCPPERLQARLRRAACRKDGNPVDAANYAMMLAARGIQTASPARVAWTIPHDTNQKYNDLDALDHDLVRETGRLGKIGTYLSVDPGVAEIP